MPYRFFLVPTIALLLGYFGYCFYAQIDPSAYLMLALTLILVAFWIFKHELNKIWWKFYPIDLNPEEKHWINTKISYIELLEKPEKETLFRELALFAELQEYIPMGTVKITEELKWISILPAIRLKMYKFPKIINHYTRSIYYAHPFITPEMEYVHVSETHDEDGAMIYSVEQLLNSFFQPSRYLNPAMYEWCKLAAQQYNLNLNISKEEIESFISEQLNSNIEDIYHWMGQKELDREGLVYYGYVMFTKEFKRTFIKETELICKVV